MNESRARITRISGLMWTVEVCFGDEVFPRADPALELWSCGERSYLTRRGARRAARRFLARQKARARWQREVEEIGQEDA